MKKLIITLSIILMATLATVSWADEPHDLPFSIDGASGGTVTGDTTVDGGLVVTDDGTIGENLQVDGYIGVNTAPEQANVGRVNIQTSDEKVITSVTSFSDTATLALHNVSVETDITNTSAGTKNFQGIKNFMTLLDTGENTGNLSSYTSSLIFQRTAGDNNIDESTSQFGAYNQNLTLKDFSTSDDSTITEIYTLQSQGITGIQMGLGGTIHLVDFNHLSIKDAGLTDGDFTWDAQTALNVEALTSATTNRGIVLDGDGPGSDIIQGASQDSVTSYDGGDYLIDPDSVGVGTVAYNINDAAGTPAAPTLKTKRWFYNKSCTNGTDDCFILPIPTTSGRVSCHINGTDQADCAWIITNAGVVTETEDNLTDDCNVTKDNADSINLYDTATIANATAIENVTGATEVVICEMIYD